LELPLRRICGFQFSFGNETLVNALKLTPQEIDHGRAHGMRLLEVSLEEWRDHSVINVVEALFGHDVLAELTGVASSSGRCSQRRLDLYADVIKVPLILWELSFGGDERLILYLDDGALHLIANGGRFGGSRADWLRTTPLLSQMPIVDYPHWPPPIWSEPRYRFLKTSFPEATGDQLFEFSREQPANDFLESTELRLAQGFASRHYLTPLEASDGVRGHSTLNGSASSLIAKIRKGRLSTSLSKLRMQAMGILRNVQVNGSSRRSSTAGGWVALR
jgi:hypothetical protein